MSHDYHARVGGPGMTAESYPIERDTDGQAIDAAFMACSPYGHSLWDGPRFLGYFDAGESRMPGFGALYAGLAATPRLPC